MRTLLALFFGLSMTFCFSQNPYKLRDDQLRTLNKGLIYFQKYADSLNSLECNNCTVFPDFFYNS